MKQANEDMFLNHMSKLGEPKYVMNLELLKMNILLGEDYSYS